MPSHVHANHTPSFRIFTGEDGVQRFQCHGNCGLGGDVVDLAGHLYVDGYNDKDPRDIEEAIKYLGANAPIREPRAALPKAGLAPNKWREYYPAGPEVVAYAATRGLHTNTLKHFRVGQYKHFMAIPIFEQEVLKGIKFRNTWPKEKLQGEATFDSLRFWAEKGSSKALFNYDGVAHTTQPLLVLKGEIPVMLMHQFGILACAITGGESAFIEPWLPLFAYSRRIVVVGDNDEDPETRAKMVAKAEHRAQALRADLKFPPEGVKDIDEWVLKDRAAIGVIRSWIA